jgi:endogenous inhibitor of DNA gyrase (YacG/DUF329 family)
MHILRAMAQTPPPPDYLLGCSTCGRVFRWIDDRLTVKDHSIGGGVYGAECPGSGTQGIDLGPRDLYVIREGDLVHLGSRTSPKFGMLCPECKQQVSVSKPPDGAFDRTMRVAVQCPRCHDYVDLHELKEGPQGIWLPRNGRSYW